MASSDNAALSTATADGQVGHVVGPGETTALPTITEDEDAANGVVEELVAAEAAIQSGEIGSDTDTSSGLTDPLAPTTVAPAVAPVPDAAATTAAVDGAATDPADEEDAVLRPIHGLGPPPPVYAEDGIPAILRDRKLYVVTSGRYVGVFSDWLVASPLVNGWSKNQHSAFSNSEWREAFSVWAERCRIGNFRSPISSRSLIGEVRDGANPDPPPHVPPPVPAADGHLSGANVVLGPLTLGRGGAALVATNAFFVPPGMVAAFWPAALAPAPQPPTLSVPTVGSTGA